HFLAGGDVQLGDADAGGRVHHRDGGAVCLVPVGRVDDLTVGRLFGDLQLREEVRGRAAYQVDLVKVETGKVPLMQAFGNGGFGGVIGKGDGQRASRADPVGDDHAVLDIGFICTREEAGHGVQRPLEQARFVVGKFQGRNDTAGLVFGVGDRFAHPKFGFLRVDAIDGRLLEVELDGAGGGIAIGRAGLGQGVDLAQVIGVVGRKALVEMQPAHHMSSVGSFPAVHYSAVPVGNGQRGAGQRKGSVRIGSGKRLFVDGDLCLLVGMEAVNHLPGDRLALISELHGNVRLLDQVAVRHCHLADVVPAAVGLPVVGIAAAVVFAADGHVHREVGKAVLAGGGGGQQRVGGCQQGTVQAVDVIGGVQFVGRAGHQDGTFGDAVAVAAAGQQGRGGLDAIHIRLVICHAGRVSAELVDADTDTAFLHNGQDAVILKLDGAGQIVQFILGCGGHIDDVVAVDCL